MFETVTDKPWECIHGYFLLFDFVHLLKNIRNNWLTEKTGSIDFKIEDESFTARWSDLLALYKLESNLTEKNSGIRGLSKLTEVAVRPKPVERQRVSTCLRVFCDETCAALRVHPTLKTQSKGTALFVQKVTDLWKTLNVRTVNKDIRHNDPRECVIRSTEDPRLNTILKMADWFVSIGKKPGGKRQKTLTIDTSNALRHTLNGIVGLCKKLLSSTHNFVMIGEHCSDPLEKEFGKLRQGSGGEWKSLYFKLFRDKLFLREAYEQL